VCSSDLGAGGGNRRVRLVSVIIVGMILFEYAPMVGTQYVVPQPVTGVLAGGAGQFGVLELPTNLTETQFYLYQQTLFNKPLVNGKISQVPQTLPQYMYVQPFLRLLSDPVNSAKLQNDVLVQGFSESSLARVILSEFKIKYVVLNVANFRTPKVYQLVYGALFQALGAPTYADGKAVIFTVTNWVTPAEALRSSNQTTLSLFGTGWGPLTKNGRSMAGPSTLEVFTSIPGLYNLTVDSSSPTCVANLNYSSASNCGSPTGLPGETSYVIPLLAGQNQLVLGVSGQSTEITQIRLSPAS
jgi:hypothetical protein